MKSHCYSCHSFMTVQYFPPYFLLACYLKLDMLLYPSPLTTQFGCILYEDSGIKIFSFAIASLSLKLLSYYKLSLLTTYTGRLRRGRESASFLQESICYCMRSVCSCWGWYWPKAAAAAAAVPGAAAARGCCTA